MRIVSVVLGLLVAAVAVAAQAPGLQADANLNQLMRGILYPTSNVIFDTQVQDPEGPPDEFGNFSGPRRPFEGDYGGWELVENSALALAESANLLLVPGRVCANGRPVPSDNEDWIQWAEGLREAGLATYRIAQMRSQDAMLEATDQLAVACANCHDRYRDVEGGPADRCMQ